MLPFNLLSHLTAASARQIPVICVPYNNMHRSITSILLASGLLSNVAAGDVSGPFLSGYEVPLTPANISKARLWITLKYRNGTGVLLSAKHISKPSRRVFVSIGELMALSTSRMALGGRVKGLGTGGVYLVKTSDGIVSGEDALRQGAGGELLGVVY